MFKTHNIIEVSDILLEKEIKLSGWVKRVRKLGSLNFIDFNDGTETLQLVVDATKASGVSVEDVYHVSGKLVVRKDQNPEMVTGKYELIVNEFILVNKSQTPPIEVKDDAMLSEETRLTYRYLDIRRPKVNKILKQRSNINHYTREFFFNNDFTEVETPILAKSTPEGARDYLVPSRVNKNQFYALPQSPQQYKQMLMIGGIEKYYQIAKVFRDEDLRFDRQPEFTQLDVEMAWVDENDVMNVLEKYAKYVFERSVNYTFGSNDFQKLDYFDAIDKYGTDRPDIRFDMLLTNVKEIFANSEFAVFKNAPALKAIVLKGKSEEMSRKKIDKLTDFVKLYKAKGLAWLKFEDGQINGPIAKFFNEVECNSLVETLNLENNDVIFFVADEINIVNNALGQLRSHLAKEYNLANSNEYRACFVVNWPLYEFDEDNERYVACHHPFTQPKDCCIDSFDTKPETALAKAYDLVINGHEVGGGSIRITDSKMQSRMFNAIGFSEEEAQEQFGFLIEAYKYGAPIHGGFAIGMDRLVMLLTNQDFIRDVIAFPKTSAAKDLMVDAPNLVSDEQLEELKIKTVVKES